MKPQLNQWYKYSQYAEAHGEQMFICDHVFQVTAIECGMVKVKAANPALEMWHNWEALASNDLKQVKRG